MSRVAAQKLLEIVRFEVVFQLRRKSTWLLFGLFLIPLIGVTGEQLRDVNRELLFNAPLLRAENSVIMSLVAMLALAAIAGDAATRDVQTRLEPLMHAAPIGRGVYVGGRFVGAFLLAAMLLAAVPLVHVAIPLLNSAARIVGPLRPIVPLQSYFLILLPNVFVTMAVMFGLAMWVRHSAGSYAGAALVFGWVQIGVFFFAERLNLWQLASLLDPTSIAVLEQISRTWSTAELNERLIGSEGALLRNRLVWLTLASAWLGLTYRRFDLGARAGARRWWQRDRILEPALESGVRGPAEAHSHGLSQAPRGGATGASRGAPAVAPRDLAAPHAPRVFDAAARVRQTLSITRDSLREVTTAWTLLVVPVLWLQITGTLNVLKTMGAGTMVLPSTNLVLQPVDLDAPPLVLAMIMFPVVLAGELIWRERDANLHALADATPVPDTVRFIGKVLGLWLVFVAVYALQMFSGVIAQVVRGWYEIDVALYLQILGLRLIKAFVFALFALSVHVIVNHKHVAHLITLIAVVGPLLIAEVVGIEHPLLVLGYEPPWRHSPISGFGPFLAPLLWFRAYWAAWVLVLAVVARLLWVRGVERGFGERMRLARSRLKGGMVASLAGSVTVLLMLGGFLFYNTNVLNAYRSSEDVLLRTVEYERRYGSFRDAPQPDIATTELQVELYPDRREADIRGVHLLVNRTAGPIDTIHVALSTQVETGDVELGRPARAAVLDDELRHRIYVLEEPLAPGDSVRMSWQVRHAPRGIPAGGISTAVVGNGTFIQMAEWMPLIGYQRSRELASPGERSQHGLLPRKVFPPPDDVHARSDRYGIDWVDLDVTVGTAADQIAVGPGALRRTWEEDGRRYFHYATETPVGVGYAIFSARYAVRQARWRNVTLEVVHHPEHPLNVDRILRGMQASLEQLSERFGPYPYEVLRFVEYPGAGGSLHASTGAVWYLELFSLFDPEHEPRRIDLPFAVVAHEVAHQFQPVPASVQGRSLLSESFAWYAALGVIEQELGAEHLERFLAFMRESYFDPRSRADVPLLRASDFFLGYRKGPFAMYALQEYVGRDSVDLAWRRLRERHASGEPPFATSLDLYRELQAVTPDSLQYLVADLIERNTFWELEAREASTRQTASGEWQVTLEVSARKVVVDTAGIETEVPMDDRIEIGVFDSPAEDGAPSTPLHLAMHRVRAGVQTVTITVARRPARAGIDPRHLLIDDEPGDNVVDIPDRASPGP